MIRLLLRRLPREQRSRPLPSPVITTSHHYYHTSTPNPRKKAKETAPLPDESIPVETMHGDDLTPDEIEELVTDAKAWFRDEEQEKLFPNWKPGQRKRPLLFTYREQDFSDEMSTAPRWTPRDRRCGAIGLKLGMMPLWDDWGELHPCTVIWLDSNVVTAIKTKERHGYDAVQIGAGEYKKKNVTKPLIGHYKSLGIPELEDHPPYILREFRINRPELATPEIGTKIRARHFVPGQNLDVAGISKGKGFQGPMKKWGFKGMPATHGVSLSHRAHGSIGQCQSPGKVFKGKKMAGRMGGNRVSMQNLRLVKIDRGRDLLYVRGAVPGNKGAFVEVRDAIKRPLFGTDAVLGGKDGSEFPPLPTFPYEDGIDGSGEPGHEIFMPLNEIDPFATDDEAA
mmetsp:Transcript_52182/g.62807  ORF Transcript_52182/g.62807 Transcript_52182/m.62807 type:complete len:396 (+) Transcript_52182:43-1230(+)|eukprot:CAMPEP_0172502204 /NCGR_PEP_ID=MMETSP1066-20121228/157804_1 /TAXON_ID=671091 /ORGANISM="Coscinodiscus wailesii, Strain CCMP2513" /LENGTH=395 /DNA_ID=CAMNT_0013277379 /DNA_START=29 /DNA_END=1216 /DNA_ORIENTATION=+